MISKTKIIIADDDPVMQKILAGLLEDNGYEVYTATTNDKGNEIKMVKHFGLPPEINNSINL